MRWFVLSFPFLWWIRIESFLLYFVKFTYQGKNYSALCRWGEMPIYPSSWLGVAAPSPSSSVRRWGVAILASLGVLLSLWEDDGPLPMMRLTFWSKPWVGIANCFTLRSDKICQKAGNEVTEGINHQVIVFLPFHQFWLTRKIPLRIMRQQLISFCILNFFFFWLSFGSQESRKDGCSLCARRESNRSSTLDLIKISIFWWPRC